MGGEKSSDPVLNDPINDLVQLLLCVTLVFSRQGLELFLSELDVVLAASLPYPIGKVTVAAVDRVKLRSRNDEHHGEYQDAY